MRFKRALRFDGVDDYVMVTLPIPIDLVANNGLTAILIFKDNRWSGGESYLSVISSSGDSIILIHSLPWTGGLLKCEYRSLTGWPNVDIISNTSWFGRSIFVGVTMGIDWIVGNVYRKVYVDGNYVVSDTRDSLPRGSDVQGIYIGATGPTFWNSDSYAYAVLIYNAVLTDSEMKYLYYNPFDPPRQDNLVLWLTPGSIDPVAGKWYDLSGNGNHGTIYGAQLVELEEEVIVK